MLIHVDVHVFRRSMTKQKGNGGGARADDLGRAKGARAHQEEQQREVLHSLADRLDYGVMSHTGSRLQSPSAHRARAHDDFRNAENVLHPFHK